jgi:hypothetical protein
LALAGRGHGLVAAFMDVYLPIILKYFASGAAPLIITHRPLARSTAT